MYRQKWKIILFWNQPPLSHLLEWFKFVKENSEVLCLYRHTYDAGYSKLAVRFPTTTEKFCSFWLGIGLNLPVEILCMVDILRSNHDKKSHYLLWWLAYFLNIDPHASAQLTLSHWKIFPGSFHYWTVCFSAFEEYEGGVEVVESSCKEDAS